MDSIGYDTIDRVFDGGRRGEWDVAFVVIDPRQVGFTFTPAYIEIDQTYLVAGSSPFMRANLKYATVVVVGGIAQGALYVEDGRADAYAGARTQLLAEGWRLAGGRVLDDSITRNQWGVAVASARADLLAYVSRFLEEAKNAGVVQDSIHKNKVEGARVAR
jgi:ABC-type amino acid transport substrate-binding protein